MTTISAFIIGMVVVVCFVLLLILLFALINVSGRISREEEHQDWRRGKE